jgi:hypothetical protein
MGLPAHRGIAPGNTGAFAERFIRSRVDGFDNDIRICLTPIDARGRAGLTHAYFPVLGTCCATLEYLAGLYRGNLRGAGAQHIADWAQQFLPQPDYDRETIRILPLTSSIRSALEALGPFDILERPDGFIATRSAAV